METINLTRRPNGDVMAECFPEEVEVAKDILYGLDRGLARMFMVITATNGTAKYELRSKDQYLLVGTRMRPHRGACMVCGCTDREACVGGCSWADEDKTICTRCVRTSATEISQGCGECVNGLADGMNNDPDQPVFCACQAGRARQARFDQGAHRLECNPVTGGVTSPSTEGA